MAEAAVIGGLSLWLVDPVRDEWKWPQGDELIAGLCLRDAHAKVAELNSGRVSGSIRYVLHDAMLNPMFPADVPVN